MAFSWWSEDPITAGAAHLAMLALCLYIGITLARGGLLWYDYVGWTGLFLLIVFLVVRANRR